nr:hypothetical protein [Tanacetum cinerariifolium]
MNLWNCKIHKRIPASGVGI